jgi:tRNA A-37 threonylcarbamoyl transferase component Bud32
LSEKRNTPLDRFFCCQEGIVGAASEEFNAQNRSLLRTRLIAVSAVALFGYVLFFIRSIFIGAPFLWNQAIPIVFLSVSIFFLRNRPGLSMRRLRLFELVIFGIGLIYIAWINYLNILHQAGKGDPVLTSVGMSQLFMSFFAFLIVYGMFIPNSWQRALAVIFPMFAVPVVLSLYLWLEHPGVRRVTQGTSIAEQISYSLINLIMGALFSVIAAHIIHSIRHTAATEKEMGRYRLQKRIGSGGMGEVWKAHHTLLARPAAIKLIRPEVLNARSIEGKRIARTRFEREARATAALRSPHTVHLYDFGVTDNDVFYYVMEYLEGLDLETLVDMYGPLSSERTVFLLKQVAKSLSEAHEKGLVHRDIKPSNLHVSSLKSSADFVRVLDFGLVKKCAAKLEGETKLTLEGSTTGTPAYMAPEVALGNQEVDSRSDIYSLGCVAYWMLTGLTVFEGKTPMETIVDHARTPPVAPSRRAELEIPSRVEELIMTCLEKDPDKRPPSMKVVHGVLEDCRLGKVWDEEHAIHWWQLHTPESLEDTQVKSVI